MRRGGERPKSSGTLVEDIKQGLTEEQLAGIGAASLAFNPAEQVLDSVIATGLGLMSSANGIDEFVLIKLGGIDNKVALVRKLFDNLYNTTNVDLDMQVCIRNTLNDLSEMRTYRNSAVHVTQIDITLSVGVEKNRNGSNSYVLLSKVALDGLYNRLTFIRHELDMMDYILFMNYDEMHKWRRAPDPTKSGINSTSKDCFAKLAAVQAKRKELPPLPNVPP